MDQKKKKQEMATSCDMCGHYAYDEEDECYYCDMNLDEDDMMKFLTGDTNHCHYFSLYDEYAIVRHQM